MGIRSEFKNQLKPLIETMSVEGMENVLITYCNLPGRRANLELAYAFADCIEESDKNERLWEVLQGWLTISESDAPADDPREFLPFCALQALGAFYINAEDNKKNQILKDYKSFANDKRWRIREAVAMGLQRIGEKDWKVIESAFIEWMIECSYLEQRAVMATLAHPPILTNQSNVEFCLEITDSILNCVLVSNRDIRKSNDFQVLKKGLEYTISVFVEKLPDEGFDFLYKWAAQDDKDIDRIIRTNLGKKRLTRKHEEKVNRILDML